MIRRVSRSVVSSRNILNMCQTTRPTSYRWLHTAVKPARLARSATCAYSTSSGTAQSITIPVQSKPTSVFAIVHIKGHQYKVCEGDLLFTERVDGDVGQSVNIDTVLLVGGVDFTLLGRPLVSNASITATIE